MDNLKFTLFDKMGVLIGYEYHERNEHGIYQIFHQSIRDDFESTGKLLVRKGYFIPHSSKKLVK